MPSTIVKRCMMVCGGVSMLTAGRAHAQTQWRVLTGCAGAASGLAAGVAVARTQHSISATVLWIGGATLVGDGLGWGYGDHADDQLARGDDLSPTQRTVLRASVAVCGAVIGAGLAEPRRIDFTRREQTREAIGAVSAAAVALFVEQRFFDRTLWPRAQRLGIRVVPVRRGLALVVQHN